MDATEQLAFDSEVSFGVLGRAGEFVLVPLNEGPVEDAMDAAAERGFVYCGILAVVHGQPGVICAPGADAAYTMLLASLEFAQLVADRLRKPKDDSEAWCFRLYALQDPRG